MERVVKWPLTAQKQLEKIYRYILQNSYQNAEKVSPHISIDKKLIPQPKNTCFRQIQKAKRRQF